MATNSSISVSEGSGKNIATHSISETTTKEIQRIEINNSSGTEMGTGTNPFVIGGDTAHGSTDANNPNKIGGKALTTDPTAVSTGQRVNALFDKIGRLVTSPFAIPENLVKGTTGAITDTTSTSVIAAQAGSLRTYITAILVTNSHTTVGTFVKILDGVSIIWEGYAAAGGGGFAMSFPTPIVGTAATAVNAQPVTTGANVIVSIAGYTAI